MSVSNFEHEYLFVLGNGASIASADPELDNYLEFKPSIENYIPILEKLSEQEKKSPFGLLDFMEESHLQALKWLIEKVIEISGRKRERDIVKLLAILEEDYANNWNHQNNLQLQERTDRSAQNLGDISTLENAIYHFVAAYYTKFEKKYLKKLWQLVQKDHSPLISLNWDINFERVIHEKNPTIPMANYYGEYIFNLLPSDQKNEPYNPLVKILKPHGSLNWLIPTDIKGTYGDLNIESDQMQSGCQLRVVDNLPTNFNSECQCFLIPPVPDKVAVERFSGLFWKIKETVWNVISAKIREYAINSRILVIIGYSFPPEDKHIENLFNCNRFERIIVFDKCEATFNRIKEYFRGAKAEFKKSGFAEIMDWLDVGEGFKPSRS
ncbi:MAG: hypothetical protein JXO51_03895 [Candidatus Aminicenantes bacterium]|nr:hypothetical protein [Candidatus Aminicenantes bacterium]